MTLLEEILAGGFDPHARDDAAIAAALSSSRPPRIINREVGEGAISNALGTPDGPLFIYQLRAAALAPIASDAPLAQVELKATVEHVWRLLDKVSLDIGLHSVRAGIDQFAAAGLFGLTPAGAQKIKALAETPDLVSVGDVSDALNAGGY